MQYLSLNMLPLLFFHIAMCVHSWWWFKYVVRQDLAAALYALVLYLIH